MKKVFISFVITVIVGGAIFLIINNFIGKEDFDKKNNSKSNEIESNDNSNNNSNSNTNLKEIESIDFKKYQEYMSEMYDDSSFVLVITSSEGDDIKSICNTYRDEIAYSFKDKKIKVLEIDTAKLDEKELSVVIKDVSKIMKYEKPSLITPTLLISKKGKVNGYEGLMYSTDLLKIIEDKKIK